MSTDAKSLTSGLKGIFIFSVIIGIIAITMYLNNFGGVLSQDHSRWAEFGDFLGGVLNPVFGFLGLLALLLTISLQAKELKLTRDELRNSSEALVAQNETLAFQNFENSFFQMLRLHNDIVNSIDFVRGGGTRQVVTTTGRDCFPVMATRLKEKYEKINNITDDKELVLKAYEIFYEEHQIELGHYFRYLYNIFKFIHNSKIGNKNFYSNLVRAQLSNHELVIIYYNCLSHYGNQKFMPLAKEFMLFKNLPESILLQEGHKEWLSNNA
ncbi:putative phage abortive infection protein [Colwellia sp. MB3u-70]|uniref:putative phage abortive infection protein n=1 Tax=unclassified Colwellia TaxID=196834 RepID=UPI0015F6D4FD|nr:MULTISPECIES: putative phage abortive infection protein [unclassified Colwellia]MBA6291060.1 putative phage abortive infection protein [Colwellia sp. MB3u-8]MBA6308221.1 putative phage abortive infection protein [Colwellia sp. MB3u-70]